MNVVAGKLDEISEAIGGLRARFDSLSSNIIENRNIADKRHIENKTRLDNIEKSVASLATDRRIAVVIISTIVGAVIWGATHLLPFLFKKSP